MVKYSAFSGSALIRFIITLVFCSLVFVRGLFGQTLGTNCPNSNFSLGTFDNWTGCYGHFATPCETAGFYSITPNERHLIIPAPGTQDPNTVCESAGLTTVFPGEPFSARLGNDAVTGFDPGWAEQLSYVLTVNELNYLFIYRYAVVLQQGQVSSHPPDKQPSFEIDIRDANTNVQIDPTCGYYYVYAQPGLPGWHQCGTATPVFYTDWKTVGMNLAPYVGQTIKVVFTTKDCKPGGHYGYAYISAYCSKINLQIGLCAGNTTATLTAPPGFQTYSWYGPGSWGPPIGGNTQTITVSNPGPGDYYYVDLTAYNGCTVTGLAQQIVYTVINSDFTFIPNCAGQASSFTDISTINQNAVVDWHWNFGDATPVVTGAATPTHVYANPGSYVVTLTSYSTEGCTATSNHTIIIPATPVPALTGPAASCVNGPALVYTTDPGQSFYVWNLPPGANLVAGGTSTSNTATIDFNTLGANVVGVSYTIPATLCSAASPTNVTVSVDPQPVPVIAGDNPSCVGVPGRTYTTQPGKINYTWTIPPQATPTAGGTSGTNFVTVTWNAVGTYDIKVNYTDPVSLCTSDAPAIFPVTVNASPTVNAVVNQVLCPDAQTTPVQFTGSMTGTTYSWSNSNTSIGLAAMGTGDIAPFNGLNSTGAVQTATVTVTPAYDYTGLTCTGTPVTFNFTVNPNPVINSITNKVFCHNELTTLIPFSASVTGSTYSWTNDNPSIGLAALGTGDIPPFTATNLTTAPVTATITVTPSFTNAGITCNGLPSTFTITVNPLPAVTSTTSQVLCHQSPSAPVSFSGNITGTQFTWSNSNATIGLAASGTGDISSFLVSNTTNLPVTSTITVTPAYTNLSKTCTGTPSAFTFTINPIPTVNPVANQFVCPNALTSPVLFSSDVQGTTFTWTNDNTTIGLAAGGSSDISAFTATNTSSVPVTATITVLPTFTNSGLSCSGPFTTFSITVNPIPTVNAQANQVLCHQSATTAIQFTGFVPGTIYNWVNSNPTIGLAASGTGDIASFAVTNITNAPVTATITATPTFTSGGLTCTGNPASFQVTVNPIPTVGAQTDQVLCHQTSAAAVTFTGFVTGTVYNWVNSNTSIGLAAAGTGNISSFTATNTTNAPVTATITTTPAFTNTGLTCTGSPASFQVMVNPIPTVNALASQVLCHQAMSATVNFTGYVPGTQYNWVNSNPTIGLAASGTGDISSFAVTNTTNAPVTATITATPTFTNSGLTCTGSPASFQVTVNPIPTVNTVANQALCHQFSTTPVSFSGNVAGTVYIWVNSNTSIGLAAAGTGNIPSFTATNISAAPVTATITVTPVFTNAAVTCTGTPTTFTIRVNPLPVPTITGPAAVCLNLPATYSTEDFQGSYVWNIPAGGVITLGQSTKQVGILWNTIGTHTITVNYVDANGCTAVLPTSRQVVVNSLPIPTLTGAITVCAGDTKTYQTQTGAQSYGWGLPASGIVLISGGGVADDHVTLQWTVAGTYSISVNYVIGTGCTAQSPFVLPVTVNPLPTPVITGSSPVCALSTQNYTLAPIVAGHLYNWTIAGGTILSGQNGNTAQVAWGSTSSSSLDLTETISYPGLSCPAAAATFPVILDPWPVAAGTINGQNSVCKTSTYTYAIPAILNATSCQWVYSGAGVSIVNNGNATISITFLPAATSGTLTVRGVNNCGSGIVSGPLDIVVHNLPEVTLTPCFDLVTTSAAKKIVLKGGSPWLLGQGVFSGNRVSFNALTGFYEFDPSGASAGTYSIAYTFTNTFGCLASAQPVSITVQNNSFSCGGNLTDVRDGKVYKTAYLALRCWMAENLAYGTALTSPGPPQTDNCLPEKYCAPTDLTCAGYGGLYQWDELMDYSVTPGTKGICPPEWHVPTEAEWQSLIDNLVGGIGSPESNALNGPSMKDLLLPVGFRVLTGGLNYNDNYWAFTSGSLTATQFWSSTVNGATQAAARGLNNYNPSISKYYSSRFNALSLRCIKD